MTLTQNLFELNFKKQLLEIHRPTVFKYSILFFIDMILKVANSESVLIIRRENYLYISNFLSI